MSTLIVDVVRVDEIKKHPNADKLELVRVKGWWVVSGIGNWQVGDLGVYFPPDSIVSKDWTDKWDITKYTKLNSLGQRICAANLRGECSYGFLAPVESSEWREGDSKLEFYNVLKYQPEEREWANDVAKDDAGKVIDHIHGVNKYNGAEHLANFPDVLELGEEVILMEKIHGSSSRVARARVHGEWQFVAASMNNYKQETGESGIRNTFWLPMTDNMKQLLADLSKDQDVVTVYGEIFGPGVQDMRYGRKQKDYAAFDVAVNGEYMDFDDKIAVFEKYQIPYAPVLYRGPYSPEVVKQYTTGPTTMCDPKDAGPFSGREGVVLFLPKERKNGYHRVTFKSVSANYLARKNG